MSREFSVERMQHHLRRPWVVTDSKEESNGSDFVQKVIASFKYESDALQFAMLKQSEANNGPRK